MKNSVSKIALIGTLFCLSHAAWAMEPDNNTPSAPPSKKRDKGKEKVDESETPSNKPASLDENGEPSEDHMGGIWGLPLELQLKIVSHSLTGLAEDNLETINALNSADKTTRLVSGDPSLLKSYIKFSNLEITNGPDNFWPTLYRVLEKAKTLSPQKAAELYIRTLQQPGSPLIRSQLIPFHLQQLMHDHALEKKFDKETVELVNRRANYTITAWLAALEFAELEGKSLDQMRDEASQTLYYWIDSDTHKYISHNSQLAERLFYPTELLEKNDQVALKTLPAYVLRICSCSTLFWYMKTAKNMLLELAAQKGDAIAQYKVGMSSETETDKEKWLLKAAQQGHADAQYELGGMHYRSIPLSVENYEQMLYWLREAVHQNHAEAQNLLAQILWEKPEKNQQDLILAVDLWKRAVQKGCLKAL
jgi:TPR repeat protein